MRQRVIAGIRGEICCEGVIDVEETRLGAQFVVATVVIAIGEPAGELRQQEGGSCSAGRVVVCEGVSELVGIAEFPADFDRG